MRIITLLALLLVTNFLNGQTQEISINDRIHGTLYKAKSSSQLAILVAGSGPTDRNGNQPMMENNSLKFLAENLADNGISTFTFDKAFIHDQNFKEENLSFESMVYDVINIVEYFIKEKNIKKITLIGHSEGALIATIVSHKLNIENLICIAGPGTSIDETLDLQISKQAPMLADETRKILSELKKGNLVNDINPMLQSVFRPSAQPYLISWMKYNPQEEIKKVNSKILLIQGTKDLQVSLEDAEKLKTANPKAQLEIIENLNHVLKTIETDETENIASYSNPELPVNTQLVETIINFMRK